MSAQPINMRGRLFGPWEIRGDRPARLRAVLVAAWLGAPLPPESAEVASSVPDNVVGEVMEAGAQAPAAPDCESSQSWRRNEGTGRMGCESQSDQPVAPLVESRECSILVPTPAAADIWGRLRIERATCSQSTSGRALPNGSAPEDSRSSEIASDSPTCWPVDTNLRRYPKVVPHRTAKARRSGGASESRKAPSSAANEREGFIPPIIPSGTKEARPDGVIPKGKGSYTAAMTRDRDQVRTENFLRLLREQYGDSPGEFDRRTGYSQSMVSQIKQGRKKIGEKLGAKIEKLAGLKRGALEQEDVPTAIARVYQGPSSSWPFSVPQQIYESLSARSRRDIDEALTKLVMGAQSQELLEQQRKSRRSS